MCCLTIVGAGHDAWVGMRRGCLGKHARARDKVAPPVQTRLST